MKSSKTILFSLPILLLLLFKANGILAQSYNKLLAENKCWDIFQWEGGSITPYTSGARQFIDGDTVINGQTYQIVWANKIISNEPVFFEPFELSGNIVLKGFIREDEVSKKIYTWSEDSNQEFLTYDFELEVGDSLFLGYLDGAYIYLDSITNVRLMTGEERRQFNFSGPNMEESNNSYIEGIGGESSLLYPFDYNFEGGEDLNCAKEENQIIYALSSCDILSSNEEIITNESVLIYPNPVLHSIHIDLGEKEMNEIAILNSNGVLLMQELVDKNIEKLNLEKLPKGIYFIRIRFESMYYYTTKLIKY